MWIIQTDNVDDFQKSKCKDVRIFGRRALSKLGLGERVDQEERKIDVYKSRFR